MSVKEKIIEGKYNYFNQGHLYSDEQFEIYRLASPVGNLLFSSEVTSRVKTGEFLKINIDYEVNFKFDPINVKIKRQLGNRSSSESFYIDLKETNVVYEFQGSGRPNYFEKIVTHKSHVAAPCIATFMMMANQRKIDPVHKTHYSILSTPNIWDYKGEFIETDIYLELLDINPKSLMIAGNELEATHCKLFQTDENGSLIDDNQQLWLSKHYHLPYMAKFGNNIEIKIETLKNFENKGNQNF